MRSQWLNAGKKALVTDPNPPADGNRLRENNNFGVGVRLEFGVDTIFRHRFKRARELRVEAWDSREVRSLATAPLGHV